MFFLNEVSNPGLAMFFKWFGLTYIFTLPSFIATCVLQGDQRFDRLLLIRFISQGSFILFVITLIVINQISLQTVVYANLLSALITSLFALFAGWAHVKLFVKRTGNCIRELFHFGKYSVGTTLSSNLFRSSDTFIINFMLGPAALAVYNLGQRLMEVVEIPLRSFAATGMPALSAAYNQNNKQEVITTLKKYAGMLTVALVPVTIMAFLFANVTIGLIGGGKYIGTEAPNVLRIFMTFALLYPVDRFFALTIDVIHQPKINFIKVLVMLAGNIIFDFVGIYVFGNIYGVALATVVPILIGTLVGNWALQRYSRFSFTSIYKFGYKELLQSIRQALGKKAFA